MLEGPVDDELETLEPVPIMLRRSSSPPCPSQERAGHEYDRRPHMLVRCTVLVPFKSRSRLRSLRNCSEQRRAGRDWELRRDVPVRSLRSLTGWESS